jgi:hypothetical protein
LFGCSVWRVGAKSDTGTSFSNSALQQAYGLSKHVEMGITPAQLAARYWGYAAQCLIVAQRQDNAGDKLALVNIAQAWVNLAEQTEKNAPAFVSHETPAPEPKQPKDLC